VLLFYWTGLLRSRGAPSKSRTAAQAEAGDQVDGRAFPGAELSADGVVHPGPGRGIECGDVVDQALGGASTVEGDQQVAAVSGRDPLITSSRTVMWCAPTG
jgi:hypothetical protein